MAWERRRPACRRGEASPDSAFPGRVGTRFHLMQARRLRSQGCALLDAWVTIYPQSSTAILIKTRIIYENAVFAGDSC